MPSALRSRTYLEKVWRSTTPYPKTISKESQIVLLEKQKEARERLRILRAFLGILGQPNDFYDKAEGSCEWINHRDDFEHWRNSPDISAGDGGRAPAFYWVSANPGTGKTTLAAHVISHLQERKLECAYYYFQKDARTIGGFLRSIAYQMARSNATAREMLFQAYQDGTTFDQDDARTIWAKLFRGCFFEVGSLFLWLCAELRRAAANNVFSLCPEGFEDDLGKGQFSYLD